MLNLFTTVSLMLALCRAISLEGEQVMAPILPRQHSISSHTFTLIFRAAGL